MKLEPQPASPKKNGISQLEVDKVFASVNLVHQKYLTNTYYRKYLPKFMQEEEELSAKVSSEEELSDAAVKTARFVKEEGLKLLENQYPVE